METYYFDCTRCGARYSYVGYKSGVGKTEAQLRSMDDWQHVCRICRFDDRRPVELRDQGAAIGEGGL